MTDAAHTRGRFRGKVAIVTGGASGIGRAIVERFVNDGAAVTVFDINESAGKEVETRLKEAGHDVTFQKVDVSDKKQCVETVDKVAEGHEGKIHALVNCAAYFGAKGKCTSLYQAPTFSFHGFSSGHERLEVLGLGWESFVTSWSSVSNRRNTGILVPGQCRTSVRLCQRTG